MTPRPKKEPNPKKDPVPKQEPNPKKEPKPRQEKSKNSFTVSIYLTASKILGYVIFIVGSVFAFIYKQPDIFIFSSSIAAGLLGLKTWQSAALERKRMEYGDNNSYGNGYGGYDNSYGGGYGGNNYGEVHGHGHGMDNGNDLSNNGENESDIPPPPPVGGSSKPSEEIG